MSLFICVDQEHGVVRRLEGGTTVFPGAMLLGATYDPDLSYATAFATGKELKALGFNWNFAPSVDFNNNPELRSPYDLAYLPNVTVYIATYEASLPALQMAAKAIYGLENVTGRLPITLP